MPKVQGRHRCRWHWLLTQEPEARVRDSEHRLKLSRVEPWPGERARVPEAEWPPGFRWCAGCQSFVPLFYTTGSRCKGCASKASHESHLKRAFGISRADYEALYAFQSGVCYICRQRPGAGRRLAVDHDHVTGEIRGLLCASQEFGCNVTLRRLLNDVGMATRALDYVKQPPWARLRAGQAPPMTKKPSTLDLIRGHQKPQDRSSGPRTPSGAWHMG